MIVTVNVILISGAAIASMKIASGRRRLSLVDMLAPFATSSSDRARRKQFEPSRSKVDELSRGIQASIQKALHEIDDRYQHLVVAYVDHSLGRPTHQNLNNDSLENLIEQLSPEERIMNRSVAIAAFTAVIAWTAGKYALSLLITIPASLYIMWYVLKVSYQALVIEHRLRLEVLWALYGILALAGGYIGAMAFSLMLGFLSSKLILITQERSHQKIANIFGQQPRVVWILVEGTEVEVPFEQVRLGDIVVTAAGQMIPVDGTIVSGIATIDQHALTGEAQPAEKEMGDTVFATTMVLSGKIHIQVEKAGQDSVAAQIGEILNNTSSYQMSLESKAIDLSNRTILPRLVSSALALPISGINGAAGILGCGIGTNLRFASPIAMLNFLNQASRNGILVKDGRSLELLSEIDTVVFDKTGTLTLEQPTLCQIHVFNDVATDELLYYAAAAEHRQTHPIAKAILATAADKGIDLPPLEHIQVEIGYGIRAHLEDKEVLVGSHRYMALAEIDLPNRAQTLQAHCRSNGHSLVFIAIDGQLAGAIELRPTIRPEAKTVIETLHQRGQTVFIISGDQEEPTRKLAEELGIDHYYANTLPEHKAELVEKLQQEGRNVCFVGDGINDSIALKKANVSISLLGATTVATDTAQIVLMDQSLAQLPALFALAQDFTTNMQRGFALAIVPGTLFIGGVFLFHWGIYSSILVYNTSLFASIGNAMLPAFRAYRLE